MAYCGTHQYVCNVLVTSFMYNELEKVNVKLILCLLECASYSDCVAARDPYCSWRRNKCVNSIYG